MYRGFSDSMTGAVLKNDTPSQWEQVDNPIQKLKQIRN
jgi:hypothetical protein